MVASISHDLRTPVSSVINTLKAGRHDKSVIYTKLYVNKKYIVPSLHQCEYLMSLINDILVHAQIKFKKEIRMTYEAVNLKNLILEII